MGWEPIVNCRRCDEPLDVYQDYSHRFCECCSTPHRKYKLPVPPLEKRAFVTLENAGQCRREAARYAKSDPDRAAVYRRAAHEHLFYARKARLEAVAS